MRDRSGSMLGGLLRASHLVSLEEIPALAAEHAATGGFSQTMIYLSDLRQQSLLPLPGQYDEFGEPLKPIRIDTTLAGLAFRSEETIATSAVSPSESDTAPATPHTDGELQRLWVPLLDGTERIGLLGVTAPGVDEDVRQRAKWLASLVALIVVSKRATSDAYARLVRADRMSVSAEVLWNLMPTSTFANRKVVVSAALEPAYDVGGDAYDYSLDGDILYLAAFDAMGHDLSSGLTASIAMGTWRNHRRQGRDLLTTSEAIDERVGEQFGSSRFVTGILAELDLRTGWLTWVNCGHHPPLVLRRGRPVAVPESSPVPPMGLRTGIAAEPVRYQLEPGDRLVFYTDGVTEARSPGGELFGLERFTDFLVRHEADGLSTPETLRRLMMSILDHQDRRLQDDATVLLAEWRTQRHRQFLI
ncbi:PP2C family protein-serine/threonine phosphatase [Thermobifida halotolerans]|nr:GAF domain-containing SpoIIE family protein phosphatase [Thermobifida halotolerans]